MQDLVLLAVVRMLKWRQYVERQRACPPATLPFLLRLAGMERQKWASKEKLALLAELERARTEGRSAKEFAALKAIPLGTLYSWVSRNRPASSPAPPAH